MRILGLNFIVLAAVMSSWPGGLINQQVNCADAATEEVTRALQERLKIAIPLQATPLPELAADLITLETHRTVPTPTAKLLSIAFYLVQPRAYELRGGAIERETVEVDGRSEWLVAVSSQTETKFFLEGSPDALAEFNKLASAVRLSVQDSDQALEVFDFFLKAVQGQQYRSRVVTDDMKLQSVALEDFRLRFPRAKRRQAFDNWWRAIPAQLKQSIGPPTVTRKDEGFEIQYLFYSEGVLYSRSMRVSGHGTASEEESKAIAP